MATRSFLTLSPKRHSNSCFPAVTATGTELQARKVIRRHFLTSKGVDLNMTLTATYERSAVYSNVVTLPAADEKEEEEEHQRTGPSESSGVTSPYPCCPKEKAVVFPGAHGCASYKCPNCGKYAVFDYDSLTSKPGKVCRGASKRSRAVKR